MNIVAGHGGSSINARRMIVEAISGVPIGPAAEALTFEVITAELSLGSMGALVSGTLGIADVPDAWLTAPWPRLLRIKLEDDTGTGYIAAGIAQQAQEAQDSLSMVQLVGVETAYIDGLGNGGSAINGGGLTIGGEAAFGLTLPNADAFTTRKEAADRALETLPNGQMGVAADLTAIIGTPESAVPVNLTSPGARNLGYTITKYVTDAVMNFGDGWQPESYKRTDVPVFAPRVTASASANPSTITEDQTHTREAATGLWDTPVTLGGPGALGPIGYYAELASTGQDGYSKSRNATIRLHLEITQGDPWVISGKPQYAQGNLRVFALDTYTSSGTLVSQTFIDFDNIRVMDINVPLEAAKLNFDRWYVAFEVRPPVNYIDATEAGSASWTLSGGTLDEQVESRNTLGVVMPLGYAAPYWAGPTWEVDKPGVHVTPAYFPDRLQHAAGAVITWNRGNASTKLLTAALPYPGQFSAPGGRRR
ncbi:hypothetical protein DKM44_12795 [Deinococcus irradiatisoli]|uniref:Uncharacterized protein n=1 Tax=Deinococcus irradiatisoli TaxID=2202254 RepID=A0A2Z3JMI0_9DEIO|nr:hypothetical protein [Deinococcus irradiatisoli]AWN23999.1 hypothetical protein DKM44_12795 [Deinococcus irradiatisoli]